MREPISSDGMGLVVGKPFSWDGKFYESGDVFPVDGKPERRIHQLVAQRRLRPIPASLGGKYSPTPRASDPTPDAPPRQRVAPRAPQTAGKRKKGGRAADNGDNGE